MQCNRNCLTNETTKNLYYTVFVSNVLKQDSAKDLTNIKRPLSQISRLPPHRSTKQRDS
jgi:hypothetical protein